MAKIFVLDVPLIDVMPYHGPRHHPDDKATTLNAGLMFTLAGATQFELVIKCISKDSEQYGKSYTVSAQLFEYVLSGVDTSPIVIPTEANQDGG